MKRALMIGLLGLIAFLPAGAARAQTGWANPDSGMVNQISEYLNNLTTLQSRFIQMTSNGNYAEGELFVARPGKLRFQYDPPIPYLLVSNGSSVAYYDFELENVSYTDLDATPAAFLVAETIDLGKQAKITSVGRFQGALHVTLLDPDNPDSGTMTLMFSENPLTLRQWSVVDPQGVETTVTLLSPRFGGKIDADLFKVLSLKAMRPADRKPN
ncbi:MAG: LolA family protein [Magnetospiraceae bacterium]